MHFDHAGIATEDADGLATLYGTLFGFDVAHEESFGGMKVVFLDVGGGYFELLEPQDDGPIEKFIRNNGPGIHHLAVATDDIEGALETARRADVRLVDDTPRPGAWGHEVAFLHPKDTGGVLMEFVQH